MCALLSGDTVTLKGDLHISLPHKCNSAIPCSEGCGRWKRYRRRVDSRQTVRECTEQPTPATSLYAGPFCRERRKGKCDNVSTWNRVGSPDKTAAEFLALTTLLLYLERARHDRSAAAPATYMSQTTVPHPDTPCLSAIGGMKAVAGAASATRAAVMEAAFMIQT